MTEKCSRCRARPLLSPMIRVIGVLWLTGCGGCVTPPQDVSVGLALKGSGDLPPRLSKDGHELTLSRLQLTGTIELDGKQFAVLTGADVPLDRAWTVLAERPLARGSYDGVKLDLTGLALDGRYDGKDFHIVASRPRRRELQLAKQWQVELGKPSALSFLADPKQWMTSNEGSGNEGILDPEEEKTAEGLMDRFVDSIAAARDDDHDGVEDK